MKCLIPFSAKNKKNITNLLSAELAQRVINVNEQVHVERFILFLESSKDQD